MSQANIVHEAFRGLRRFGYPPKTAGELSVPAMRAITFKEALAELRDSRPVMTIHDGKALAVYDLAEKYMWAKNLAGGDATRIEADCESMTFVAWKKEG